MNEKQLDPRLAKTAGLFYRKDQDFPCQHLSPVFLVALVISRRVRKKGGHNKKSQQMIHGLICCR